MKKQQKSPYGTSFNKDHYTQQIDFAIPIIMKLGFNALEAHVLDRLIRFSDISPKDVWASQGIIAYREGCSTRSVSRAISKAIKKKLIIVTQEAKIPPSDPNVKVKLEDLCRHYNIVPLLLSMATNKMKEELEKEPDKPKNRFDRDEGDIIEPHPPVRFGKAKYNYDSDDLPDEATEGWKNCKECHRYGPPDCRCKDVEHFN